MIETTTRAWRYLHNAAHNAKCVLRGALAALQLAKM